MTRDRCGVWPHAATPGDNAGPPALAPSRKQFQTMPIPESDSRLRPMAVMGERGPLIGFYRPPDAGLDAQGDVLVVPAFGEEMNRCRSMVAMQAQALAAVGVGTLVLDPHGTGDSSGEFDEGDWDAWRADLWQGVDWLRRHGNGCRALWGVRLGALMAAEMAAEDRGIDRLLLWMPVVAGKAYWTQFLRIRIAAEMADANGVKSTEELRQRSAKGQAVEASGYLVGPLLAAGHAGHAGWRAIERQDRGLV